MRILLLCASILGLATMVSAQETVNVNDGHIYKADAKTGVTCKNKWIIDRIHTSETFLNLQFIKDYATRAKTAVIDKNREKIYIGYSKRLTTIVDGEEVSNDYAHLVILDLKTGAYEKELPLTVDGVAISGLLCANQVGIDDADNIWICGMTVDACIKPAQIYVVEDLQTGACRNVGQWALPAEESSAAGRCDYWDVVGDITGAEANAVCMGAVGATASGEKLCLYRWELAQGATEWVANEDGFAGYVSNTDLAETYPADQVTWGQSSATVKIVAEEGFVGSMFYVDGFTTCPSLYDTSLRMVESFASAPDLAPQVGANGVEEFSLNGKYYLAYVEAQYNVSPGCRVNVCQLGEDDTFNGMRKLWSLPEGGLGEVSDGGNRVHSIDTYKVVDKNGKEGVYLLTYKCNNGLGLYCIAEDGFIDNYPDFEEKNEIDGVIYEVIDQKTVKVKSYSNRNSNIIEIPSQVDINGKAYLVTEIGSEAFIDCTGLTSVTIPNSITLIGASAFSGCSGLTEVYYNAENCSTMGSYSYPVFRNCSNLKKLNIGNNVKTIPNYAFKNCTGLTEITIPNSITAIGSDAFYGCTGLTEVYYNAENCSTMGSYSYPVFHGCSNLKKLNIGNNVKIIPNYAFYNCSGLTEITIPNSVTAIGDAAFYGCSNLKLVINLSNLTISKGASNNGYVAYYANNVINAPNGSIVEDFVFSKANNTNTLIAYLGNANELILPNDFNGENYTIGANAFYNCSNLTSVTIPNSVTSIGASAFSGCSGLTEVTIPNSITAIGSDAFYGCTGLTEVNISEFSAWCKIDFGGGSANPLYYAKKLKLNGSEITNLVIPNDIPEIKQYAFYNCSNLTSVTIPNSITSIGASAFQDCSNLTEVYYNAENCSTMGSSSYPVFYGCSNLKKLNIGNNVKTIPNYAFKNCTGLTEITIPNSVTVIGDAAFYGCSNLKFVINLSNLTISKGASNNGYVAYYANNVINAPNGSIVEDFVFSKANNTNTLIAYLGNANELILPNDFNGENYTIGANAFYNCSNLTSVTIPNSITAIGSDAFSGCSNLTTLILEDGSEDISGLNFPNSPIETLHLGRKYSETFMKNKTSLIKMTVGNNVTKICEESFYGCTNLTDVEIPNSVTKIGKNAFWNCNKLITNEVIDKTQTTVSIALATPTKFQTGIANENEKIASESNNIFINGLKPNTNYTYNSGLIINDIFCDIKTFAFTTKDLIFYHSDIIGATSASLKAYYEGDVSVIDYGINWGNNTVEYNNLDSISVYNLDPNTTYYVYYFINTKEGGEYSTSWSIKTKLLTWNAGEFTATSTTSARLSVETNCDAIEGTGFEWKRYDAPNDLTPYKAPCPIVNGTLKGSLRGLNSSVYYKCRPYYTSSSGKTHYGAWFAIFTGDANVYFEPEVSTSDKNTVVDNSAIINGYALAGSDDILEQGFEYWKTSSSPTTYSSSGVMIAKASGISMSATISDLEYNSTYKYRAFAKTEKGTIYGKEVEFKTGNDPVSVENIEINNSSIEIIEIARYDIHGRRLSKPTPGFNIVIYSNGTTRKEIVKLPPTTIKSTNN